MNIKICSWNINSIRNKIQNINDIISNEDIDILFVSETKITPNLESGLTPKINSKYEVLWNSNKLSYYHGTCLIYRKDKFKVKLLNTKIDSTSKKYKTEEPEKYKRNNTKIINSTKPETIDLDTEKAHKSEGRIMICEVSSIPLKEGKEEEDEVKNFILVGTYSPNSGVNRNDPLRRLAYRTLRWDPDLYLRLNQLKEQYKNVIWCGDLNVVKNNNDMSIKLNIAGTTVEERKNFNTFLTEGGDEWLDAIDINTNESETNKSDEPYTYNIDKKLKLRLDYFVCSKNMKDNIEKYERMPEYVKISDHIPISINIKL